RVCSGTANVQKRAWRVGDMEGIAKLISASAWALVALMLAAGIPFAWRRVLAWIDAKSQVAMAEAVRRMIEE
ncbi:MAG: hypothetical protein NTX23_00500, partial [Candidatus Bipolaricaulota bacterium]|nr:hypothetical protein [Candidatus Bipolaricaulota bacterium]